MKRVAVVVAAPFVAALTLHAAATGPFVIGADSYGPVKIGMRIEDAEAANPQSNMLRVVSEVAAQGFC